MHNRFENLLEVVTFAKKKGDVQAMLHYGIKKSTLKRYKTEVRIRKKSWRAPKILLLDIETLPMIIFSWSLFMKTFSPKNIIQPTCILSWAAKWLYSSEIAGDILTPGEAINRADKRILVSLKAMMNDADIIIAHNGDRFDIKKINGFFWRHEILPPSPYQTIDTLKQSYKTMNLDSHKQEWLTKYRGLEEKFETDFPLWVRCSNGDQDSLDEMFKYNKQDVNGLEEMYVALRPWMQSHPNMGIYMGADSSVCPACGSQHLDPEGEYITGAGQYKSYRCLNCGHFARSRFSSLSIEQKRNLLVSTAR